MKRLASIFIFISLSLLLIACEEFLDTPLVSTPDYGDELLQVKEDVIDTLPSIINRDFNIPYIENYEITIIDEKMTHESVYIHQSPLFDQESSFTVRIEREGQFVEFEHQFMKLSYESGRNETKIYLNLPVSIDTLHSEHKEIYTDASVRVDTNINGIYQTEIMTDAAQLRGRGNSTWFIFDKKPYRLRFDKNTSILGMPEAKNYVLLAEYSDKSLMRNVITQKMVSMMSDLPYANQTRFVELYINNEYRGVYVLTEHVETHPNKFYIETTPGVIDTGYFLEMDQRLRENGTSPGTDWFYLSDVPYELKEPDPLDPLFLPAQFSYIRNYMEEALATLRNDTNYENYIDVDNFIQHFIIHEFVKNVDVGWSSVFMYKASGEKLKFGPLWDFDLAFGNADYIDYGPENFYGMRQYKNQFFIAMMQIPEIRAKFRQAYFDFYFDVIPSILLMIDPLAESLEDMADRNYAKWPTLGEYVWPNPEEMREIDTFRGQVQYVYDFIEIRSLWLLDAVQSEAFDAGNFES